MQLRGAGGGGARPARRWRRPQPCPPLGTSVFVGAPPRHACTLAALPPFPRPPPPAPPLAPHLALALADAAYELIKLARHRQRALGQVDQAVAQVHSGRPSLSAFPWQRLWRQASRAARTWAGLQRTWSCAQGLPRAPLAGRAATTTGPCAEGRVLALRSPAAPRRHPLLPFVSWQLIHTRTHQAQAGGATAGVVQAGLLEHPLLHPAEAWRKQRSTSKLAIAFAGVAHLGAQCPITTEEGGRQRPVKRPELCSLGWIEALARAEEHCRRLAAA